MAEGGQVTPRTAAGRRFVAAVAALFIDPDDDSAIDVTDEILAIEREAQGIPLIHVELLRDTPEDRALLERIGHSFANWAPGHSKEWAASLIGAIKAERTRPERMRAIYARLASESGPLEEGPS